MVRWIGFFEGVGYVIFYVAAALACVVFALVVAFLWPFILFSWLAKRECARIPIDPNESFGSRRGR